VNTIAPIAATRMTETVLPPDTLEGVNPDYVVPLGKKVSLGRIFLLYLVAYLASEKCNVTGATYECAGGYVAKVRW